MFKRIFAAFLGVLLLAQPFAVAKKSTPEPTPEEIENPAIVLKPSISDASVSFPELNAEAGILIDRKTGDILYQKNADKMMYPASTTKIMTAVLAFEKGNLSDNVTASKEAIEPITLKHSHMGIKVGETLTLEQLLYGMLVYSANDAANVIGVHIAGSLQGFTDMMNQKAAELGLSGTKFKNAHGFHEEGHFTTAKDLAILTEYAMRNEKFCEIVKTWLYRIPANEYYTEERVLSTTNHLISRYRNVNYVYKYAIGVKTGFTDEAGSCLVSAATKDETELIAVVLKAYNLEDGISHAFADSAALYEYAFNNYQNIKVASLDNVVSDSAVYEAKKGARVALFPKENVYKLMPKALDKSLIETKTEVPKKIKAPIKKGDVLGSVTYTYKGQEIGSTELVAGNDVERDIILAIIHFFTNILTSPFFFIPAILIIYLILRADYRKKQRRKKRRERLKYTNYNK